MLADPILPIFAVAFIGYLLGHKGVFSAPDAQAINRFVFQIGVPALVFSILVAAPIETMRWGVLLVYFGAEIATYVTVALLAALVFGIGRREALLLGMAASFSNHVFFVRPIAILLLGPEAGYPVSGVIVMDVVVFSASILITEILTPETAGTRATLRSLARNPFVYTPFLAVAYRMLGPVAPEGILTYAKFVGGAASPASLFSLGVILAGFPLGRIGTVVWIVVLGKLLVHPLLFWFGAPIAGASGVWMSSTLMVAAGPCGAMAFVIALQYGVKTERIAKAVLISTALSVLSLSVLAQ